MNNRYAHERAKIAALDTKQGELRAKIFQETGKVLIDAAAAFVAIQNIVARSIRIGRDIKELVILWSIS